MNTKILLALVLSVGAIGCHKNKCEDESCEDAEGARDTSGKADAVGAAGSCTGKKSMTPQQAALRFDHNPYRSDSTPVTMAARTRRCNVGGDCGKWKKTSTFPYRHSVEAYNHTLSLGTSGAAWLSRTGGDVYNPTGYELNALFSNLGDTNELRLTCSASFPAYGAPAVSCNIGVNTKDTRYSQYSSTEIEVNATITDYCFSIVGHSWDDYDSRDGSYQDYELSIDGAI